jgi:serine/threonine protein kinase
MLPAGPLPATLLAEEVRALDPSSRNPQQETGRLAGTDLGAYRLGELLGEGGMAEVYRARQRETKRDVAIKVLVEARAVNQKSFRERFEREWRVMQAVSHPHVVALLDWPNPPSGPMYFAMELLEGETLAERLDQEKRLPLDLAKQLFMQLAEGLAAVHAAGIIHRDIKPLNIFLCTTTDGSINAKILDFGLARVLGSSITGVGLVVGTPAYVAPEQASGDRIDHRVDIYALGLVMYRVITGQHPFKSEIDDQVTTLGHQLLSPPPPLSWLEEEIPPGLEALVLKMLRKRPEDRPQTIQSVIDELVEIERVGYSAPLSRPSNPPGDRYGPLNPLADSLVRTALVSKGFREKKP